MDELLLDDDQYCSSCDDLLDVYSIMEGATLCAGETCEHDDAAPALGESN